MKQLEESGEFFESSVTAARILIVEDEFILAEDLQNMLVELGYRQNYSAFTDEEAIEQITKQKPDLVLLDIMLDGKSSGLSLAHKLRYEYKIPYIFISSHLEESILREAKKLQPYGYLVKPVRVSSLYTTIEVALYKFAYEDVSRQEQEKQLLLEINAALLTLRNRSQLIAILEQRIAPLFHFDYFDLALGKEAGCLEHMCDTHKKNCFLSYHKIEDRIHFEKFFLNKPEADYYLAAVLKNEHPTCSVFEQVAKSGVVQLIGAPLKVGNEVFGILCFYSEKESVYKASDIPIFQYIVNQMAMAISNLLFKEQIVQLNKELQLERDYLIEEVKQEHNFEEIVGSSPRLLQVFKSIDMVAKTEATVLIEGETGTGKELIARAVHNRSHRKNKPIIKVNCATLPHELIESELFGHEKGSFTGAFERRIGKFELSHNSTLFLDEIGELPIKLQAKLLRAIQEKEIERLGGKEVIKVDVRIIAATNRNLLEECEKGNFRADLYYRLNVFPIKLPPLRERKEDISLLATHFALKYCSKMKFGFKGIKEQAMAELLAYDWPGNIRELQNLVEQACILNQDSALTWARELITSTQVKETQKEEGATTEHFDIESIKKESEDFERQELLKVLKQTNWRIRGKDGAAEILNIKPTTLEYRLKKLGLK